MSAYYNENDPYAAQWLRNLIAAGHIAAGDVDERSIADVQPDDLRGYAQCHFFAGIGGWSYALRIAGWDDGRPVWTGSCPCQPLSGAGQRKGHADERHLWPAFYRLIAERRPATVFGEQVASSDGREWLAGVRADLEAVGYAVGAADLCAAGVSAPHIRQRLYWMADDTLDRRGQRRADSGRRGERACAPEERARLGERGGARRLADADDARSQGRRIGWDGPGERAARAGGVVSGLAEANPPGRGIVGGGGLLDGERAALGDDSDGRRAVCGLADADRQDRGGRGIRGPGEGAGTCSGAALERLAGLREDRTSDAPASFWRDPDWLLCRDGRWRPVEPGTFPLVDGTSQRVGRLRAYGNAIVPQVAAAFIRACG